MGKRLQTVVVTNHAAQMASSSDRQSRKLAG